MSNMLALVLTFHRHVTIVIQTFILTSFLQFVLLLVPLTEHLGITFLLAGHHIKACNMAIQACIMHNNNYYIVIEGFMEMEFHFTFYKCNSSILYTEWKNGATDG